MVHFTCYHDNSSEIDGRTLKLYRDAFLVNSLDEFDVDLSVTYMTPATRSRSASLVTTITLQRVMALL